MLRRVTESSVDHDISELKSLIKLEGVEKVQVSKYWMSEDRVIYSVDIEFREGDK